MKEKKTIVLVVILMALVGVYVWYSQKIDKSNKPTGKKVDITRVDPNFKLKSKVSRAVRDYIKANGKAPSNLNELKGKYLDEATLKQALAKNMKYRATGPKSYRLSLVSSAAPGTLAAKGSKTKGAAATTSSTAVTTASTTTEVFTTETGWKYDPLGKPDPFKPFILAAAVEEETQRVPRPQLTPLQKMPLSEIQKGLKAIIWGQLGNKALVEDATGKGYVVQEGTYVGQHDGIVKKIYRDRIIVEEYRRDPAKGRVEPNEVVLKLKKVESEK